MEQGLDRHVLSYFSEIDLLSHKHYDYTPSLTNKQLRSFINRLKALALREHEILVLVEKFAFNKTLKQITEDNGFTSIPITAQIIKSALNTARKRILKEKGKTS